jgi:predicted DNA-binding transcriptional regulator AlpA
MQVARRLLNKRQVIAMTSLCSAMIDKLEAQTKFPTRVELCWDKHGRPTRVGWYEDEVQDWVVSRRTQRHTLSLVRGT